MSKYERRIFLDRLVELRETYHRMEHEATSMTVDQVIAHAIDLLDHPEVLDAVLSEAPAESSADTASAHHIA